VADVDESRGFLKMNADSKLVRKQAGKIIDDLGQPIFGSAG
jgi:hypothetical protein